MNLILEMIGHSNLPQEAMHRKVFGTDGGRIGRASDCDWVLVNPYISRHHATVYCIENTFYIESTGENGVALNTPQAVLPQLARQALRAGDRLFIDEYEIAVAIEDMPAPLTALDGALEASSTSLDPLAQLTGSTRALRDSSIPEVAWNASSSLKDHYTPPRMTPRALPVAEDWNDTGLDRVPAKSTAPLRALTTPQLPPMPAAPAPALFTAAPATIPTPASLPFAQPTPAPGTLDISPLLHALKVDPETLSPEALETLSQNAGAILQGLIDILRARAQFRSQFRMQDTRITVTENNPLKFAINAQDALGSLFGDPNPAYMGPAEAFAEAFDDMRLHQVATLAGMRAGFESLMSRFDPQALQQRFDRRLKRAGFLPLAAKLRYWDLYQEQFEDLSTDPNSTFQRMFGEAFADAYERQLEALQSSRRKPAS